MAVLTPHPRPKDMLTRLVEWVHAERAWPDLSELVDIPWREAELPSFSSLADRLRREAEWPSLAGLLERVQADAGWTRVTALRDRVHPEVDLPSLSSLVDKLQGDMDMPELPGGWTTQNRQALRGVLLLGMVLHTSPAPLSTFVATPMGGRTRIEETRSGPEPAAAGRPREARYVLPADLLAPSDGGTAAPSPVAHATDAAACIPWVAHEADPGSVGALPRLVRWQPTSTFPAGRAPARAPPA